MKNQVSICLVAFLCTSLFAQDDIVGVSDEACACLNEIDQSLQKTEMYEQIHECIDSAIMGNQLKTKLFGLLDQNKDSLDIDDNTELVLKDTTVKNINITINTNENKEEIEAYLLQNCPAMKNLLSTENSKSVVSVSENQKAIDLYNLGLDEYRQENFKEAIKYFKKAVREDSEFAFALDMIGISYRRLDNYKQAIKYYDKSLEVDPYGRMPLMNKPLAYALSGDLDMAIKEYSHFIDLYPKDPEGYYGIGRAYFSKEKLEEALDNMMRAFLLYKDEDSPYVQDAETNISMLFQEFKKRGKLEVFNRLAEKYDIKIGQ